jgi:hypothetical protein
VKPIFKWARLANIHELYAFVDNGDKAVLSVLLITSRHHQGLFPTAFGGPAMHSLFERNVTRQTHQRQQLWKSTLGCS